VADGKPIKGRAARSPHRKPTEAELANDPSLRYWAYRRGELLWSDQHQEYLRFDGYTPDGGVRLLSRALADLPGAVRADQVRRPGAGAGEKRPYSV
jgi:hypothetical protein